MSYRGEMPKGQVNVKLNHPMADEVSIIWGQGTYTTNVMNRELAFFKNGEWVTDIIPEFAEFADMAGYSTRVYGWVPVETLVRFLGVFMVGTMPKQLGF